ncbi:hypothetical protein GW535_18030 (plasmid) [Piscirickettsia salmonis]|uniref:hypothetical protein n=1 Tax=Piscirickettsia salmonis TaxID=1238 RepID=UPI00137BD2D5|nr:hypothetical protein [Piscirickettsia salmonis]QHS34393.1 hypothetical protein GW535_18030 [Piscirickettsia salmonis]
MSLTTKETHKVDYKDEDSWMPKWSPNGHYLAFLSKKVSEKSNDNALSLIKIWSKKTNKIYLLTETKNNIKHFLGQEMEILLLMLLKIKKIFI